MFHTFLQIAAVTTVVVLIIFQSNGKYLIFDKQIKMPHLAIVDTVDLWSTVLRRGVCYHQTMLAYWMSISSNSIPSSLRQPEVTYCAWLDRF